MGPPEQSSSEFDAIDRLRSRTLTMEQRINADGLQDTINYRRCFMWSKQVKLGCQNVIFTNLDDIKQT